MAEALSPSRKLSNRPDRWLKAFAMVFTVGGGLCCSEWSILAAGDLDSGGVGDRLRRHRLEPFFVRIVDNAPRTLRVWTPWFILLPVFLL